MEKQTALAEDFEAHRRHLKAVAFRILGNQDDAEDALQESWLRLSRSDASDIHNLGGWLTTVVARICLSILRSRKSRREVSFLENGPDSSPGPGCGDRSDPAEQALLEDSVGTALHVVLDRLSPSQRLAYVLHDLFEVPFNEIAGIVGCSVPAARQLASRARHKVEGAADPGGVDLGRKWEISEAFLAASRDGDFDALLSVLDPEVIVRPDSAAARMGVPKSIHGGRGVATFFKGHSVEAEAVLLGGTPGGMWAPDGRPRVIILFTFVGERISVIDVVADPLRVGAFDIQRRK